MELDEERSATQAVLTVRGEMDVHTAYEVYAATVAEAEAGMGVVTLDLAEVTFADSTGLSILIRAQDDLANLYESRLVLRRPSDRVANLLCVTAMDSHFEISA